MKITTSVWHEFSTTVERGPLVYALKIEGEETQNRREGYGKFTEVIAKTPWNYGLLQKQLDKLPVSATVAEQSWDGEYPWNLENAPDCHYNARFAHPRMGSDQRPPVLPGILGKLSERGNPQDRGHHLGSLRVYYIKNYRVSYISVIYNQVLPDKLKILPSV